MKRTISYICILTILAFSLVGCKNPSVKSDRETKELKNSTINSSISSNEDSEFDKESIEYLVTKKADYVACYPKDMYELADVVVCGKWGEKINTYVGENSFPITQRKFNIGEIFKGTISSEEIVVEYYGGSVPLASYLETLTPEQIIKQGFDSNASKNTKAMVTYAETEESVSVNFNDMYMLFLSYDDACDTYFVLCDAYGACKMSGENIYSLAEKTYTNTEFLHKK